LRGDRRGGEPATRAESADAEAAGGCGRLTIVNLKDGKPTFTMDLLDCRAAEVAAGPQCLVARQTHTIIFDWKVEPNGPQLGVAAGVHYRSTASGWSANSGCCPDFALGRETATAR
jgi:hypothetical protein